MAALEAPIEDYQVEELRKVITNEDESLAARFRALYGLKGLACEKPPTERTIPAIEAIAAALTTPSDLLKHDLAYCLGQTRHDAAINHLRRLLKDQEERPINRHEAAEALGALGDKRNLELLKELRDDPQVHVVVRETCDVAAARIEWEHSEEQKDQLKKSDFASIDPAPPLPLDTETPSISELERGLLDTALPLFMRYRYMFTLRDLASPPTIPTAVPAVQALAKGFGDTSALFRHEIAFVFGQLSHEASIPSLVQTLGNTQEEGMVRHEAAEALGSLGEEPGVEDTLRQYLDDPERVVRESVIVALDMAEHEKTGELNYATIPKVEPVAA